MGILKRIPIVTEALATSLFNLGSSVKSWIFGRLRPSVTGVMFLLALLMADSALMAKTPSGTGLTNTVTAVYSNLAGTGYSTSAYATNVVSDFVQFNVTSTTSYAVIGSVSSLPFDIQSSNNYSDIFRVRVVSNMVTNMTTAVYGDTNDNGTFDAGDIRITNTPALGEGDLFTCFLQVSVPPSAPIGITNRVVIEVKTVRSNVMSNYVRWITNTIITYAPTNAVKAVTANDGMKLITDFGGSQFLNASDILVNVTLDRDPKDADNVWIYYDVSENPDGAYGPNMNDRAVKLSWNGMTWQGLIPANDSEFKDGETVKFIVSVDHVVYDNAGTPYMYQIKQRPDQGQNFNVFPTILDLRIDQNINILYEVVKKGRVRIDIYDLKGDLVRRYDEGVKEPGKYGPILWDGKNHAGMTVAVGMYFVTIRAKDVNQVRKVIIIK